MKRASPEDGPIERQTGEISPTTVRGLLEAQCARSPHRPAVSAVGGRVLSYSGLLKQVDAVARALCALGIGSSDPVAVVLENGTEMAVAALGVACAAVCAPLNPRYRQQEYEFFLADLRAKALIVQVDRDTPARAAARSLGTPVIEVIPCGADEAGARVLTTDSTAARAPASVAAPHDVALMLHTSGTTSRPKLVPLTHANLCISAANVAASLDLTPADRCLNVMPLFHIHGLVAALLASLSRGASVVCAPGFLDEEFFGWIDELSPSWYTAVPTIHQAVIDVCAQSGDLADRHPLRFIRSSSSALSPRLMASLEQTFGCPVIEAYGMTEAAHQITSNPLPPGRRKPGSAGRAAGPEVAIMGLSGELLPPASVGEIVIRGANVTPGYLRNPQANGAAFTNGWFRTGDEGRLDEEGYLFITGRIKEMISRGAEKVSPREIDEALLDHPQVAQAAAFAVEHPRLGEDIAAAVVPRTGAALSEQTLREFLFQRLADFKVPARIVIVDRLPTGATGKIGRMGMAQALAGALETSYEPPCGAVEQALARIWCEVLGVATVGRTDNFFQLGGDSLRATQLNARVLALLGADLPLVKLFHHPSLTDYAEAVEAEISPADLVRLRESAGRLASLTDDQLHAVLGHEQSAGTSIARADRSRHYQRGRTEVRRLPALRAAGVAAGSAGAIERQLTGIFEEVLHTTPVRRTDNFFDLGGHSLLASQVAARIREELGANVPLRRLFEGPTVADLAVAVNESLATDGTAFSVIGRHSATEGLPVSYAQQRLWFIDRFLGGSTAYNIVRALRLAGPLEVQTLEYALAAVAARHEALRTHFDTVDGRPRQVVGETVRIGLEQEDMSQLTPAEQAKAVADRTRAMAGEPFDLGRAPLLRVSLLRLAPEAHVLVLVIHHIVADGWSMGVLMGELSALYAARVKGHSPALDDLPIQYVDYTLWQREQLEGPGAAEALSYWRDRLRGAAVLELPTDRPRPAAQSFRGAVHRFTLPAGLTEALKALSRRSGSTMYMTLLTAFQVLLGRYSGQTDVVVGSPIAGRERAELEQLIGFFVNTLVLRVDLSGSPDFLELLGQVRERALEAYAHQQVPFERLVEELLDARDLSRNPLVQVMFALQNMPDQALVLPEVAVEPLPVEVETAKFDLSLTLTECGEGLRGEVNYATDLFESPSIERLVEHFEVLLQSIVADPKTPIDRLAWLGPAERERLLVQWNATRADYPRDACLAALFEAQVHRAPDAAAVHDGDRILTYGELNAQANRLAHYLRSRGVGPEVAVGVCLHRSAELVVAVLAILKAGGAYVPLEASHPPTRLAFMLEDAGCPVLVTKSELAERFSGYAGAVLCVDRLATEIGCQPADDPGHVTDGSSLAYVIYTSGSTGQPKGVAVTHRSVARLVCGADYVQINPDDRIGQMSTFAFDAATFEVWGTLLNGAGLVLVPADTRLSAPALRQFIEDSGITVMFVTTALFNQLVHDDPSLFASMATVLFGGENADAAAVRRVLDGGSPGRLLNVYGPTETTTFATCHQVIAADPPGNIPIGRPISNTTVYVLDASGEPVPIGVPGELYIGGDGVARSYVNRPALTEERFVDDTFAGQGRLYRTGDLVRWRADGVLEFLGRVDRQVKLRGYRIELGEVEAVLGSNPAVGEAVAMVREDVPGDRRLVAYVVPLSGSQTDGAAIRAYLKEAMPDYMVPSAVVVLDQLPLNANGKVDRDRLPAPRCAAVQAPRPQQIHDTVELHLLKIWEEVLDVHPVRSTDNFFDLGGHSLLAAQLFDRVAKHFGRALPLDTLWYDGGTVAHMAALLRQSTDEVEWPTLVVIKAAAKRLEAKRALFCVHTQGGNLFHYYELAQSLHPDQPVYGLQARGVYGRQQPDTSVEAIAAGCIDAMVRQQPQGPYCIAGFSSGGVVAFEVAQQLHARGETVALLALLDTYAPGMRRRGHYRDRVRKLLCGRDLRYFQERAYYYMLHPVGLDHLRSLRTVGEAHRWAHWAYTPREYPGVVDLFLAEDSASRASAPFLGWGRWAAGGVVVHRLAGSHGLMVKQPVVTELAVKIQACLDNCRIATDAG